MPTENSDVSEIFVLDDDRDTRDALRLILTPPAYQVTCFNDEIALLNAVRKQAAACVLLDLVLPGRSGLEIMEELSGYQIPVIMISGHGDIPIAVKAIQLGALDFIEKPFQAKDVVRRMEVAL